LGEDAAADLFKARGGGGVPEAVNGGVEPELEENVVSFEGDVGEEFATPVAFRLLDGDEGLGAAAAGFAGGAEQSAAFADELDGMGDTAVRGGVRPEGTHREVTFSL
jgi:hypothetical protein